MRYGILLMTVIATGCATSRYSPPTKYVLEPDVQVCGGAAAAGQDAWHSSACGGAALQTESRVPGERFVTGRLQYRRMGGTSRRRCHPDPDRCDCGHAPLQGRRERGGSCPSRPDSHWGTPEFDVVRTTDPMGGGVRGAPRTPRHPAAPGRLGGYAYGQRTPRTQRAVRTSRSHEPRRGKDCQTGRGSHRSAVV